MTSAAEYEAAYFTLLRAREEHTDLLGYQEYLSEERRRLDAFSDDTRAREGELPKRLRRPVAATTKGVAEAVGRRRKVVDDELAKVGARIEAAQAFVEECEAEVAQLRR